MAVFTEVPGATVVTKAGGVFRQVSVFTYDGRVFARHGGGFIALHRDGGTSAPKVSWESLEGVTTATRVGKTSLYVGGSK